MSDDKDKEPRDADDAADAAADADNADEGGSDAEERMDLPKWNRARVKRKAPKGEERDAFQTSVRRAGQGAKRRAPLLLGLVVLVGAGLGGAIWWSSASAEKTGKATELLASAAMWEARGIVVEEPDPERKGKDPRPVATSELEIDSKVDKALADLAAQHPDSAALRLAPLIEAGRAMRAADFEAAEAAYRKLLDDADVERIHFLAREGVVLALEAQGKLDDALTEVEPLLAGEPREFYRDQALWHKGRLLEANGDADGALAAFRQYLEEFPPAEQPTAAMLEVMDRMKVLDPAFVPPQLPLPPGLPGNLPLQ